MCDKRNTRPIHPSALRTYQGFLVASLCLCNSLSVCGFAPNTLSNRVHSSLFGSNTDPEGDITRTLARAQELLKISKAKLAAREKAAAQENSEPAKGAVPFFASKEDEASDKKRSRVTKFKDEDTGLITTDGEMMAKLSEDEKWEVRSLDDVFEDEIDRNASKIAERDIAASVQSMRTHMQMEDYRKIFDPRNRFIGEN